MAITPPTSRSPRIGTSSQAPRIKLPASIIPPHLPGVRPDRPADPRRPTRLGPPETVGSKLADSRVPGPAGVMARSEFATRNRLLRCFSANDAPAQPPDFREPFLTI